MSLSMQQAETVRQRTAAAPLPPPFRGAARLAAATMFLLVVGCGGKVESERVAVYPVEGTITFKGQPMPGAFVTLHPKAPQPNVPAPRASIGADGALKVTTYSGGDGAPEGEYVLTVIWYKPVQQGADLVNGPNVIPAKYSTPETSDKIVRVAASPTKLDPIQF